MKRALLATAALFLLAVAPQALEAQTGSIAGRVVAADGRPLAGAQVSVVDTQLGTLTGRQGRYRIDNVPVGEQTVSVRSIGYATGDVTVTVAAGQQTVRNFTVSEAAVVVEDITVTVGSRAMHTTADELAVPVDIYPAAQIVESGQVEMASVLNELSPAIYFPRRQIADITSGVRPFQLRGLAPDHALVLINGKRRHSTAVVNVFGGGAFPGGSGVDMNAFPIHAVSRMEILRDGAAAQYGSDAIAGVINLQLKNQVSPPEVLASVGNHFPSDWPNDGRRYDMSVNWGVGIGDRGVLNLTGTFSQRDSTNRAGADPRPQIVEGDEDVVVGGEVVEKNNPVKQPNHLWGDGEATNWMFFANFELPFSDDRDATQLYAFGGVSRRQDLHSGFYRRSLDARNWPQVHPLGFLPKFDSDTRDISAVAGIRGGSEGAWNWDISTQYGSNRLDQDIFDSHNASLGPCLDTACTNAPGFELAPGPDMTLGTADDPGPNKTRFYAGSLENNQFLINADVFRRVDLGLADMATLAFGASFRNDNYKVIEGEPRSYLNGFHPAQDGTIASSGSQVFAGYRPEQSGSFNRQNVGVYGELEAPLSPAVLGSLAGRFENYSDFGSTINGKLAFRFELSENFIFRVAGSTGFRAPALSQIHYGHVSTSFRTDPDDPNNQVGFEVGEFPIDSPEARAVGAVDLKEEVARSLSGGIALTPTDNLHITLDGYLTDVDDAIVMSNSLGSEAIQELLVDFAAEAIRFFSNAIDIRTYGLDLTVNWRKVFGDDELFETIWSANWSQVKGRCPGDNISTCVKSAQGTLGDEAFDIYDEFDVFFLEEGRPDWRGMLKLRYSTGDWRFGLGANYYGEQQQLISLGVGGTDDQFDLLTAKVTLDAEVTAKLSDRFRITVGAENLLDNFPTRFNTFSGIFTYDTSSGMGFNGRYLYSRVRVNLP